MTFLEQIAEFWSYVLLEKNLKVLIIFEID